MHILILLGQKEQAVLVIMLFSGLFNQIFLKKMQALIDIKIKCYADITHKKIQILN